MATDFSVIKFAVQRKFNELKKHDLFRVELDKDKLWETYLNSFPEGTNPIYKKRTEYDCSCCRHFIRNAGDMVGIVDNKLVSIWDVKVDGFYQVVTDALSAFVKQHIIDNIFLHTKSTVGVDKNYQQLEDGQILTWHHFFFQLPPDLVSAGKDIGTKLSDFRSTKDVCLRSLKEITLESVNTVLELISQNSLYRGEEHQHVLKEFLKLKKQFEKVPVNEQDNYCWSIIKQIPASVTRIRNTAIGTLLTDLSEGYDLEDAVKSFESKVAPTNYKRPTALITKSMIDNAKTKLDELGLTPSLERRFAVLEDITINNVLFADRSAKKRMDSVFDELTSQVPEKTKNLNKVEEVNIEAFITNILPNVESIEVMFENKHANNLVSLISPSDMTAKHLFKWDNNFSWSYVGEVTDSIKERVKKAGGKVDGDLRCSLSWFNHDDLDLHMKEDASHYHIYFGSKLSPYTKGNLDVDMNAGGGTTRTPVENICYPDRKGMKEGNYKLYVNQYSKRESSNVGFEVEIEFDGQIHTFAYPKALRTGENVDVATIKYTHKDGFKIVESLPSSQTVKTIWGLPTQTFHKASVLMFSPNYWDEKCVGNKHYFFMLDGCVNDGRARGFFNEFLKEDLNQHRKVLEIVGSKMTVQDSENQLSGLGFSSTQRNSILCKVKGNFTRMIKVMF